MPVFSRVAQINNIPSLPRSLRQLTMSESPSMAIFYFSHNNILESEPKSSPIISRHHMIPKICTCTDLNYLLLASSSTQPPHLVVGNALYLHKQSSFPSECNYFYRVTTTAKDLVLDITSSSSYATNHMACFLKTGLPSYCILY